MLEADFQLLSVHSQSFGWRSEWSDGPDKHCPTRNRYFVRSAFYCSATSEPSVLGFATRGATKENQGLS